MEKKSDDRSCPRVPCVPDSFVSPERVCVFSKVFDGVVTLMMICDIPTNVGTESQTLISGVVTESND